MPGNVPDSARVVKIKTPLRPLYAAQGSSVFRSGRRNRDARHGIPARFCRTLSVDGVGAPQLQAGPWVLQPLWRPDRFRWFPCCKSADCNSSKRRRPFSSCPLFRAASSRKATGAGRSATDTFLLSLNKRNRPFPDPFLVSMFRTPLPFTFTFTAEPIE